MPARRPTVTLRWRQRRGLPAKIQSMEATRGVHLVTEIAGIVGIRYKKGARTVRSRTPSVLYPPLPPILACHRHLSSTSRRSGRTGAARVLHPPLRHERRRPHDFPAHARPSRRREGELGIARGNSPSPVAATLGKSGAAIPCDQIGHDTASRTYQRGQQRCCFDCRPLPAMSETLAGDCIQRHFQVRFCSR